MLDQSTVLSRPCARCGTPFVGRNRAETLARRYCSSVCGAKNRIRPPHERVWKRVDKTGECWPYVGDHIKCGYGVLRAGPKGTGKLLAHRVAFECALGAAVPDGFEICHVCDNPACVRNDEPDIYVVNGVARPRFGHLWLGTHHENMLDARIKGRLGPGLRRYFEVYPEAIRRGERHFAAKLTADDVRAIRLMVAEGVPYSELARVYCVSAGAVRDAARGRNWAHIA